MTRWYLGSMNDGLFIIDTPPRPAGERPWHERPGGPGVVLPVHGLSVNDAQRIVEAHNSVVDEHRNIRRTA